MNPNNGMALIRVLLLALLATMASASLLSAEDYSCKFSVPHQITWGKTTLPPGDYTFKLNTDIHPFTAKVEGEDVSVYVPASGLTEGAKGGQSSLIVVRRGGKGIVRTLFLADQGMVFSYNLPKGELPLMAQEPQLIQRIPVLVSGK